MSKKQKAPGGMPAESSKASAQEAMRHNITDKPSAEAGPSRKKQIAQSGADKPAAAPSRKMDDVMKPEFHKAEEGGINYLSLPIDAKQLHIHGLSGEPERYIYIQRNDTSGIEDEEEKEVTERSVRVWGVPVSFSDEDVAECMSVFGTVEAVFVSKVANLTPGMKEYTVVYETLEEAENAIKTRGATAHPQPSGEYGLGAWAKEFFDQRPNFERLQMQVDIFLNAFDQRTEYERKMDASKPLVDEDGFILVTYGKRRKSEAELKAQRAQAAREYRKKLLKQEEMLNSFYKFQDIEQRQNKIAMLRKKFEEDKAKIQEMKASRKFKPF